MAFNGAGVFARIYNWVNDRDAAININASRMDDEMDGMATGLSNCVTKDGQTTITANLPMSGFRHTGVDDGTARDDYAAIGQVQDGTPMWGGSAGGTGDEITIALSPPITAYVAGQRFLFISDSENTGSVTLAVNGLTATDIVRADTTALQAGEIQAAQLIDVVYDGLFFILQIPPSADDRYSIIAHQIFS